MVAQTLCDKEAGRGGTLVWKEVDEGTPLKAAFEGHFP